MTMRPEYENMSISPGSTGGCSVSVPTGATNSVPQFRTSYTSTASAKTGPSATGQASRVTATVRVTANLSPPSNSYGPPGVTTLSRITTSPLSIRSGPVPGMRPLVVSPSPQTSVVD